MDKPKGARAEDSAALLELAEASIGSRVLQIVAELGIADHFPEGPAEPGWLAARTGADEDTLVSFLRLLAGHGVFRELPGGTFELTSRGALLRSDDPSSLRDVVRLHGFNYPVLEHAGYSLRTGEPAFPSLRGQTFFEHLRDNPGQGTVFGAAMAGLSRAEREDVLTGYDFSPYRHVVDVGGGDGTLLASILRTHPEASGTLFDQPHVVPSAERTRDDLRLHGRMDVVAGDFFTDVVPKGDLHVLKSIIHDWSRPEAEVILRHCREAMSDGGRLVLFERVLLPDNAPSQTKSWDVLMRVLLGGAERTVAEFQDLFESCGLAFEQATRVGPAMFVVEAVRSVSTGHAIE
ncbi:methyltransferase [Lentzea sp. NBRC 102530]|uniref:methyltransferase n=1 Tax=Lentzea sp. NBRC 102530 TaxID=3032201 RepID=UPI0024A23C01|nr:methyltransferase [Lentzea sp. NBRC 102530]GLY46792.1 methyltransferase [Lentzea sp. NBRC 102530]